VSSAALETPVLLVLFNRPDTLAEVFAAVRAARPKTLLLVADGPRPDHPEDVERCASARAVVDHVDWPCEVLRDLSDENLQCDPRVKSGIDWAFQHVDELIVLEDDMVPHPTFFRWCEAMLDRYRDDPTVKHVSGRNELGRWGPPGADHLITQRANVWSWATWRSAWDSVDHTLENTKDPGARARLVARYDDPVVAAPQLWELDWAAADDLVPWDHRWLLGIALADGLCVSPTVNLCTNLGFRADATHTSNPADLRGTTPVFPAPEVGPPGPRPDVDPQFDLWCVLVDLMATYLDPQMVRRLARSRKLFADPRLCMTGTAAYHLTPFDLADVSLQAVHHLWAVGVHSTMLDALEPALRQAAAELPGPTR
jgi:hypothetical protein